MCGRAPMSKFIIYNRRTESKSSRVPSLPYVLHDKQHGKSRFIHDTLPEKCAMNRADLMDQQRIDSDAVSIEEWKIIKKKLKTYWSLYNLTPQFHVTAVKRR